MFLKGGENPAWPISCFQSGKADEYFSAKFDLDRVLEVSKLFSDKFNCRALVLSSGQSCISLAIKLMGLNRSNVVHIPRWGAHCIWRSVGGHTNASVFCPARCDAALAVNHYGINCKLQFHSPNMLIEDSVDTLYDTDVSPFLLGGRFVVVSLSKTLGTYTGGVIFFTGEDDFENAKLLVERTPKWVAVDGATRRHSRFKKGNHAVDPDVQEYRNHFVDNFALDEIELSFKHYAKYFSLIKERHRCLDGTLFAKHVPIHRDRLGPVAFLPSVPDLPSEFHNIIQKRHVCLGFANDDYLYSQFDLLPLHFGVSDLDFQRALDFYETCA